MTHPQTTLTSDAARARRGDRTELHRQVGQWELVELAADGDRFRVYRARPVGSPPVRRTAYALKMLRPERQHDPQAVHLLAREALAGRRISHPHLVSILQASISRPPQFVVMPWLSGSTLRSQLDGAKLLDLPEALWIARQVAGALGALDEAGWMHGDVKPSNIFVSPTGHVTLLDLGFARRRNETGSAVDRCLTGTCNYLAPEMITSAIRADIRSDIYSLGVVLFEVLAGRLPFEGNDLATLTEQHRQASPPNLRRLVPQLPDDVVRLVRQMLAKDPLRRPQNPQELADRLATLEIATFSERPFC
jgi:serine/threonine-protein kinase